MSEAPANELAEAERKLRRLVETRDHPDDFQDLRALLAEYDRRGGVEQRAQAVAHELTGSARAGTTAKSAARWILGG